MRCPECNKFVSFDMEGDPLEDGVAVDADGVVTVDATVENVCEQCNTTLTSASLTVEIAAFKADVQLHKTSCAARLDVDHTDLQRHNSMLMTGKNGKPLKPSGWRQMCGVEATVNLVCRTCDHDFGSETGIESILASAMEEI